MKTLFKLLLTPIFKKARAKGLGSEHADQVLQGTWRNYTELARRVPKERGLGGRLMVRLAAVEVALFQAFLESGFAGPDARQAVADAAWLAYEKMAVYPEFVARITARHPTARLRAAIRAFRFFPFGPPAYRMEDVDGGPRTVAFNVRRCPVAEYFAAQGLSELCVAGFCNLDYPLAAKWGAVLDRTGTLAGGAVACDFRWIAIGGSRGQMGRKEQQDIPANESRV